MLRSLLYTGPSIESLQADYAKQGRIDADAFIKSHAEILVNAPVARVWQILADAPHWPSWMPGVKTVHLDSTVAPDATFTWKSGSSTIRSTFAVVQPEKELTWTGISAGAKGLDRHTLQATDGGTRVFTEESIAGPFAILFINSAKLLAIQQAYLSALKQFAETHSS